MLAGRGERRSRDLKHDAELAEPFDVLGRRPEDEAAALRRNLNQTLELQQVQSFANRCPADAERACKRLFRKGFSEAKFGVHNRHSQALGDDMNERVWSGQGQAPHLRAISRLGSRWLAMRQVTLKTSFHPTRVAYNRPSDDAIRPGVTNG